MIDHTNKVIFIHIPRCAGTTIERMFMGLDYWDVNPVLKHASASVYRNFYAKYWDVYYKFSIVRNPYDRYRSMWKYHDEYKLKLDRKGAIVLSDYIKFFGRKILIETQQNLEQNGLQVEIINDGSYFKNCVYGNYLNVELDEIFQFEDLDSCFTALQLRFPGITYPVDAAEASSATPPELSHKAIKGINRICRDDFDRFGYTML